MCGFAGSSGNKYLLGLRGRIWADFEVACEDENRSRIKNRRQVRRSVRSLLPAVRAVTGRFREFQSGVKIEGVISHLRSSSTRAYYHKKIIGVILDTEAGRKILCKRFSTKSRVALESRADSGLDPLIAESHGGQNGMRAGTA